MDHLIIFFELIADDENSKEMVSDQDDIGGESCVESPNGLPESFETV
jgi:hypothetical protein